jgi:hypothetical protein
MKSKSRKVLKVILISILALIILLVGGFYVYTLDFYKADDTVQDSIAAVSGNVKTLDNMTVFYPQENMDSSTGFIFYPGGKVEAIAYAPLLIALSQQGITCMLLEMPFNLAVFDVNAADDVYAEFSQIKHWYLGGHSLGGAMSSSYVGENSAKLDGLILLGAYPINDADISTLALYGSEDVNLNLTKLENVENKIEIVGGNHAYFGNYGEQKGDGTAIISRDAQQVRAVSEIVKFIGA